MLEAQSAIKLDASGSRAGQPSEITRLNIRGNSGQICMIERIEHVDSKLKSDAFGEVKVLCKAGINVPSAGYSQEIIARGAGPCCRSTL